MTIVGTFAEHRQASGPEVDVGQYSLGTRGNCDYDEMLDMAGYFVGEHASRGLNIGSRLVGIMAEVDDTGLKTWNFLLPYGHSSVDSAIAKKVGITISEYADEQQSVFADRELIIYSYSSKTKRVEDFGPLNKHDHRELDIVKRALESGLLEDRQPPVVPTNNVS